MSNISTAFDALKTLMETLFPEVDGWNQLTNPYDIAENTDVALMQGWGVAFGPATNTNRLMSCQLSVSRNVLVTFARARFAGDVDTEQKETQEKQLFEDQYKLLEAIENDPTLNNNSSGITRILFQGDAGIEDVVEGDHYIKLTSTLNLEYFENLT